MKHGYVMIRMWITTHKALRLVAALSEESMIEVLDRLVLAELKRLQEKH